MRAGSWSQGRGLLGAFVSLLAALAVSASMAAAFSLPRCPQLGAAMVRDGANEEAIEKLGLKQAKNFEITYQRSSGEAMYSQVDDPKVPVTVSFQGPNHMAAVKKGAKGYVAVADSDSIRVLFPSRHFGLWLPVNGEFSLLEGIAISFGGDDPLALARHTIGSALSGQASEYKRLPNEKVAGRECLVIRETIPEGVGPTGWSTTQWFDREYGLPLRWRSQYGRDVDEVRAVSVKIDKGVDSKRFSLTWPGSIPVFRGRLDFSDVSAIDDVVSGTERPYADEEQWFSPGLEVKTFLKPGAAPAGFAGPFGSSSSSGSEFGSSDKWWYITTKWFSKSGGVIIFTQGGGASPREEFGELAQPPGDVLPVTVRKHPGQVLIYHKPYDGLILTWSEGDLKFRLEGTGVSEEALVQMGDAMKKFAVTVAPVE